MGGRNVTHSSTPWGSSKLKKKTCSAQDPAFRLSFPSPLTAHPSLFPGLLRGQRRSQTMALRLTRTLLAAAAPSEQVTLSRGDGKRNPGTLILCPRRCWLAHAVLERLEHHATTVS